MCTCVSCGVSACAFVWLCVLWLPSVTCVGHVLSVRLGEEEEPRDSRAQRRDSGRQTARVPRPQDCSEWCWSSDLNCYMLLECPWLNEACALTHICKAVASPPYPNSYHSPQTGLTLSPFPRGLLLKSNVYPFTKTHQSIRLHHQEKDALSYPVHACASSRPPPLSGKLPYYKNNGSFGTVTEVAHTHPWAWVLFLSP